MSRRSLGFLVLLATAFIALHAVLACRLGEETDDYIMHWAWIEVVIYALAMLVVLRDSGGDRASARRATIGILVVAGILRAMLIFVDPVSSDVNRYIWDGRVQAAGINPYLYVPADPHLAFLRDADIYPEINRADYAHTIYPPLAQIVFFLVTRVSEQISAMKAAMVGFEIAAGWAILRLLAARRLPPTRILLYAWHPLPIWEFAGSGHVDAIALACVMLALLAAELGRPVLAGVALGGAALVKYFPVLVAPAAYRRWDWRLPLAALVTVAVLYVPYLGAGRQVFGFLSGYSQEEGLSSGVGFYLFDLLKVLVPTIPIHAAIFYAPVAVLVLAALCCLVLFRHGPLGHSPGADIGGAFLLVIAFTVLTSPHFPWYLAWLVPFLCFVPSWPAVWLTGSATLMYTAGWPPDFAAGSFFYLTFFALLACEATYRRLRTRRLQTKDGDHGQPVTL